MSGSALNLTNIPPAWRVTPLFAVAQETSRKNLGLVERNLLSLSYGRIVRRDIETSEGLLPQSFEGYQIVEPGDTVLRLTDLQNDQRSLRTGLVPERGIITSAYLNLRPTLVEPRWLNLVLYAYDVNKAFYAMGGGLRQSMGYEDLRRLPIPLPSLGEQRRIANYLDDQTTRIDQTIQLRQQQMALLDEAFQVLKLRLLGFGPHEGQVGTMYGNTSLAAGAAVASTPVDWKRARLKSLTTRSTAARGFSEAPLLSLASTGHLRPRRDDQQPPSPESLPRYLVVRPGELVINPMWLTGGAIAVSGAFGAVSPDYRVLRISSRIYPRFLHHVLRSRPYLDQYKLYTRADTTFDRRVSQPDLDSIPISFPDLEGQKRVARELDEANEAQLQALDLLSKEVDLLVEYKRSVIAAAITGGPREHSGGHAAATTVGGGV